MASAHLSVWLPLGDGTCMPHKRLAPLVRDILVGIPVAACNPAENLARLARQTKSGSDKQQTHSQPTININISTSTIKHPRYLQTGFSASVPSSSPPPRSFVCYIPVALLSVEFAAGSQSHRKHTCSSLTFTPTSLRINASERIESFRLWSATAACIHAFCHSHALPSRHGFDPAAAGRGWLRADAAVL